MAGIINYLNSGEGFKVFDSHKEGEKGHGEIDAKEIYDIATRISKMKGNNTDRKELISYLNTDIRLLNASKSKKFDKNAQKHFDSLVSKYSKIFSKISVKYESKKVSVRKETKENTNSIKSLDVSHILNSVRYSNESSESDIILLQKTLNKLGANLSVDGDWGKNTRNALLDARKETKKHISTKSRFEKKNTNNGKTQVEKINSSSLKSADKYLDQLDIINIILSSHETNLGDNGMISKHIGVIGILREMTNSDARNFLDSLVGVAKKKQIIDAITIKAKGNAKKMSALLSTAVKALISFGLSGGTSVSIDLFGIKIGSHMVEMGKAKDIAKKLGVKDPDNLSKVLRDPKTNVSDIQNISDKIAGRHFDGGAEKMAIDKTIFGIAPAFLKSIFKFLGAGSGLYDLLEKFEDPQTNSKQRKEIARNISSELSKTKVQIDKQISLIKKGRISKDIANKNPLINLHLGKLSNNAKSEAIQDLIDKKTKLNSLLQKTAYAVENRHVDLDNGTKTVKENVSEAIKYAKEFDKKNNISLPNKYLNIKHGRFGTELPTKGNNKTWETWINENKNGKAPGVDNVSALGNIIGTFIQKGELGEGKVDLKSLLEGLKKGKMLLPGDLDRKKFKDILTGNQATSGSRNNIIKKYGIYEFTVNGHKLHLKSNCSNVQDTTPDVSSYVEEGDYYAVSATIKRKNKIKKEEKTIKERREVENPDTQTRTNGNGVENNSHSSGVVQGDSINGQSGDVNLVDQGGDTPPVGPNSLPTSPTLNTDNTGVINGNSGVQTIPNGVEGGSGVVDLPPVYEYVTRTEYVDKIVKSTGIEFNTFNALIGMINTGGEININELYKEAGKKNIKKEDVNKIIKKIPELKGKGVIKATSKVLPIGGKIENTEKQEFKTYKIRSGDTLSRIAKKFDTTISELVRLNSIKNVNKIRAGKNIKVK